MTPIHQLLARIRHDPQFGQGVFELGYLDRFDTEVHRIALGHVDFRTPCRWTRVSWPCIRIARRAET